MTDQVTKESFDALLHLKGCTVEYAVLPALTVNTSGLTGIDSIFQLEEARLRQYFYAWPMTFRIKDEDEQYHWLALDAEPGEDVEPWSPIKAEFVEEPKRGSAGGITFSDGWALAAVPDDQRPAIYNCFPRSAIVDVQVITHRPYAAIYVSHESGDGWLFYAEHDSHAWLTFDEEIIAAFLGENDKSLIT